VSARTSPATSSATSAAARPTSSSASSPPSSRRAPAVAARSSTPRSSTARPTSTRSRGASPRWGSARGTPWYDLYETADGEHVSVGALEPQFWAALVERIGVDLPDRDDPAEHAAIRAALTARFKERTQAEWAEVFDGTDACVAPVVRLADAPHHPHLAARGTFVAPDGVTQPAPAPRFSRTSASIGSPPPLVGEHTREALAAWGIDDVDALIDSGAAIQASRP
jgi:crotonobetainyl-CoA:carnitine CoA-transferase CaiB-like acyl-CoA transferase